MLTDGIGVAIDYAEKEVKNMNYKTIVIDYAPKAKKMAAAVEKIANEYAQKGWEMVSFSVTPSAKVIALFRVPECELAQEPQTQQPDTADEEPEEPELEEEAGEEEAE